MCGGLVRIFGTQSDAWREWLKLLFGPLALFVAALIDPFGVESAAANASLTNFQRLYAPFYPQSRQQDIVVVSITKDDLPLSADADIDWPPRFDHYAQLIDVIAGEGEYKPAGVFFDFLLDRPATSRDPVGNLCAAIARAKARGVDVIFAAHPDTGDAEAFEACVEPPVIASATWRAREGGYGLSYDVAGGALLTAAAELYRRSLVGDTAEFDATVSAREEMTVMWGARAPAFDPACTPAATDGAQWRQSLRLFVQGFLPDPEAREALARQQKCLYHPSFPARLVMGSTVPAQKRLAAQYFSGKFVLVGAALSDGLDYHPTPVHGTAPGVFLHAMALDNLLTYGADFVRRPAETVIPFIGMKVGIADLLQSMTLLALACGMALLSRRMPARAILARLGAGVLARGSALVFLLSLIVAIVSFTFFVLRWTPINWGGVAIAGVLMIIPWNFIRDTDGPCPSDAARMEREK